jgi:hypothetical protein
VACSTWKLGQMLLLVTFLFRCRLSISEQSDNAIRARARRGEAWLRGDAGSQSEGGGLDQRR